MRSGSTSRLKQNCNEEDQLKSIAHMETVPGIDVSTWDGDPAHVRTLDWCAYTWPFVFIKASESTVPDPLFRKQWAAARTHTLRGAYHFFRPITKHKLHVIVQPDLQCDLSIMDRHACEYLYPRVGIFAIIIC
jgi:GH25 family lysozyme M1 (1,4-beta-N-acetylmuramidase)